VQISVHVSLQHNRECPQTVLLAKVCVETTPSKGTGDVQLGMQLFLHISIWFHTGQTLF